MKYNRRNNKEEHRQMRAPVYEALETLKRKRVVPFDVPGHKRGRGNPELVELLGEKCVSLDVNSMKPLDNLCHPVSVIKEAEELAALVKKTRLTFGVMHTYVGYPMVKLARDLVARGDLGRVAKVVVQYPQGWMRRVDPKKTTVERLRWRMNPKTSGMSGCMADIGTHAANLAEYVTGLRIREVLAELTRTSHRHYSPGFYFGREQARQATDSATYIREWEFVGTVESWENGVASCQQRGKWSLGDTLEVLCPDGRSIPLHPEWIKNEAGESVESTPHAMEKYTIPTPELPPMSLLRRKV